MAMLGGAALLLLAFIGIAGWNTVDSGKVGVTRRFGKITGVRQAGGFWEQPIGFSMVEYDLRVAKTLEGQQTALKNQQTLFINKAAYQYNLTPQAAQSLLANVGTQDTFETNVVIPKLQNAMKQVTPAYTADQVFPERTAIEVAMEERLASDLSKYNVEAGSVDITLADMDFDPAFRQAIDAKAKAQQEEQVERANLEKQKQKNAQEIQQAETDANRTRLAAKGEADANRERAAGDADAIKLRSGAEAEGNKLIRTSLNRDIIDYQYAQNWNGQLPSTVFGGSANPSVLVPAPSLTTDGGTNPTATASPTPGSAPGATPTPAATPTPKP